MICPHCQATRSRVVDSRESGSTIRRRRECLGCGHRWTTYEVGQGVIDHLEQTQAVIDQTRAMIEQLENRSE